MKMTGLNGADIEIEDSAINNFVQSLVGKALFKDDAGYDEARVIFNGLLDIKPALIVQAADSEDVVKTVNFARNNKILLSVKGGGHSAAGKCLAEGSVNIDLRNLNGVRVDPVSRTAWVGGGALLGDMDRATQEYGLAAPAGIVSDTGVAGLSLAGGFGWIRGKYGMSVDNIKSVQIVTADGQVLRASSAENEDLYWGVRGGSGNFGVVTEFEFALHPVGPDVMFSGPIYPVEMAKEIIVMWREFMNDAPDEYTGMLIMLTVPPFDLFPEEIHGKDAIMLGGVYAGDAAEGERFVQPLRDIDGKIFDASGIMKFTKVQSIFDSPLPQGALRSYLTSLYLCKLDDQVIDLAIECFKERPAKEIPYVIQDLSGASQRVRADATAFGDRSAPYNIELNSAWLDAAEDDQNIKWTRESMARFKPFSSGGAYLNHTGLNEEGEAQLKRTYGKNYERLREIKKKYDPDNLFRVNQNIHPAD